ncbi:MAG: hypothetical protein ACYC1P_13105, partial [Gaiellaceae bacterium]
MTTIDHLADARAAAEQAVAEKRPRRRPDLGDTWWRHLVAVVALLFALFPAAYIASAAFNADETLTGASLIPREVTLDNFRTILSGTVNIAGADNDIPYTTWYRNTLVIAFATAILTVMLGALAAYAFSRFRFK